MRSVELLPVDLAFAVALGDDIAALAESWGPTVVGRASALAGALRRQLLALPDADLAWGGFVAVDPERECVVGTCGFKGAATDDQAIEISYFTFPAFQGRGYATEMARALVEMAWSDPSLSSVCAHTLPHPSASTRVLGKLGMRRVGEVHDPVEGPVWRWRLARPSSPGSGESAISPASSLHPTGG